MALDKQTIAELHFKSLNMDLRPQDTCRITAFALAIEDHVLANHQPVITASYETNAGMWVGQTNAPIKRVDKMDDGSFDVVIDAWPVP